MKTLQTITTAMLIALAFAACSKKNNAVSTPQCLISGISESGNSSSGSVSITYNTNKTMSAIASTGGTTYNTAFSYVSNSITISYSGDVTGEIVMTLNSSGQLTNAKYTSGSSWENYAFTYSGQKAATVSVTKSSSNSADTYTYSYDANGNLTSISDGSNTAFTFTYDATLPAKQGDVFWFQYVSYTTTAIQDGVVLYPVHNKNLCTGFGTTTVTYTYDDKKNIATISANGLTYIYNYDCGY